MRPIRSPVILANCVRRSIESVAIIAVELDFASDGVFCPIWIVASIVWTTWWITWWVVRGRSYLDGNNCDKKSGQKRSCHLKIYTASVQLSMVTYRKSI